MMYTKVFRRSLFYWIACLLWVGLPLAYASNWYALVQSSQGILFSVDEGTAYQNKTIVTFWELDQNLPPGFFSHKDTSSPPDEVDIKADSFQVQRAIDCLNYQVKQLDLFIYDKNGRILEKVSAAPSEHFEPIVPTSPNDTEFKFFCKTPPPQKEQA